MIAKGRLNRLERCHGCPVCGGDPEEISLHEVIKIIESREQVEVKPPVATPSARRVRTCPSCGRARTFLVTKVEVIDDGDNGDQA
jgi:hypothetical protein